jgi:hypothetical protein
MTDHTETINVHLDAYAEPDRTRREELLARAWTADGELFDPPMDGSGVAGISALTDIVLTHYPEHRFRLASAVDDHHHFARYAWDLVAPDGVVAVSGTDVAEFAVDGRLRRIVGFFGPLQPIES